MHSRGNTEDGKGPAVLISMMGGELGDSSRSPGQGGAGRRQPDSSLPAKPHAPVQRGQQYEGILSLSGPCAWFVFGSKCTGRGGVISQPSQRFPSMSPNPTKGLGDEKEERNTRHTEVWVEDVVPSAHKGKRSFKTTMRQNM